MIVRLESSPSVYEEVLDKGPTIIHRLGKVNLVLIWGIHEMMVPTGGNVKYK